MFTRLHLPGIGIGSVVFCCIGAAGGLTPQSIDGTWSAYSDGLGSTLSIVLSSESSAVSGSGVYSVGAIRTGVFSVAGTYRHPVLALSFTYDHGETVLFGATVTNDIQMKGKLTYKNGTVIDIAFVRP